MGKSDNKSQVLGDDPLAWLNAGSSTDKKTDKKKASKKKVAKKAKPGKASSKKDAPKKETKAKKLKADLDNVSDQFVLESSLVINKASDVYETLKKFSENKQSVEIDASKVENIDSAILQLLVAFSLDLKKNDIKLSWHEPTEGLKEKATILGLTESLGL